MAGKRKRGRSRSRSRSRLRSSSSSRSPSRSRSRSRSPSRSRSRSRSPAISVSRSPARSRSMSMSPVKSKSLPDEYRIVYQTTREGGDGCKWFMVTIPTHQIQFLERFKPGSYNTHNHRCHDPTRFLTMNPDNYLSYLGDNDLTALCDFTVLGSHAYALFGLDMTSKLDWLSYSLYNHDDDVSPRRLSPPLCPTRYFCTSLSLHGKIYLLGGFAYHYCPPTNSFAEVYDPVTDQWSDLPRPDDADVLIRRKKLFIASLGDLDGRILVYDYDTPDPMFYYYDVVSETWTCRVTPPPPLVLEPEFIIHKAVLNKDDGCLYWIDERECFLYCFDHKTMQVFSGPIVGMEDEHIFIYMESINSIRLIHLWGDFFCLVWCTEYLVPPYNEPNIFSTTEYHFTFIRVVKHPFESFFRAFVLGCFMDSYCGHPFICDASLA